MNEAMPLPDAAPETMTQVVIDFLRRQIVTGELQPGAPIRQEKLAAACGTSRVPVREALQRLEAEGLVTMVPHAGARVASLTVDDVHEVYLIRERLEPLAAELSVPHLRTPDVAALRTLLDEMEVASQNADVRAWIELNREFHMLVISQAGMPRLRRMIDDAWNSSQAVRHLKTFLPGRTEVAQLEHRLLVVAIESKDPVWAADVVSTHVRRARRELETRSQLLRLTRYDHADGEPRSGR